MKAYGELMDVSMALQPFVGPSALIQFLGRSRRAVVSFRKRAAAILSKFQI
jgi:hypothetical protein